jgi:hypothetical protein
MLLTYGHTHDVEIGKPVNPTGGLCIDCVDKFNDASFGIGQAGLHNRDGDVLKLGSTSATE